MKLKFVYELIFCLALASNILISTFDALYLVPIPYTHLTVRDAILTAAEKIPVLGHSNSAIDLLYDPYKGIERHRTTQGYLNDYEALKKRLMKSKKRKGSGTTVSLPDEESIRLMQSLIATAEAMIKKRPPMTDFSLARKDGDLELMKDRMRVRFLKPGEELRFKSARKSFRQFFSAENLSAKKRVAEFAFFDREIVPLFKRNYFRWIGSDGLPKDYFSLRIDLWFIIFLFLPDFFVRWIYAIYRAQYRRWYLFPIRNWFDLTLLISPHHAAWFRLFRMIPLYARLKRNNWLPGDGILPDLIHENAGVIAEEISGMVAINLIERVQKTAAGSGTDKFAAIMQGNTGRKLRAIADSHINIIASKMMPVLEPEIEDLTVRALDEALAPWLRSPIGAAVRMGMNEIHRGVRTGLKTALDSPEGKEKLKQILRAAVRTIIEETLKKENISILQERIADLLEDIKTMLADSDRS